jgi:hypothetical protein
MAIRITEFAWFDQVGDLLIINGYLLFKTNETFGPGEYSARRCGPSKRWLAFTYLRAFINDFSNKK